MNFDISKEKIELEKDGKLLECDVLFTFNSLETKKSYIGYTDKIVASNGRRNIYISSFDPLKNYIELENIEDEKELNMVYNVLQQLDND